MIRNTNLLGRKAQTRRVGGGKSAKGQPNERSTSSRMKGVDEGMSDAKNARQSRIPQT